MKSEIKELWVNALRSGDYPQASGWLRTDEGYCCLGVLCELGVKAGVIPEAKQDKLNPKIYRYKVEEGEGDYNQGERDTDGHALFLPKAIQEWAGIDAESPTVPTDEGDDKESYPDGLELAEANDAGESFDQIAARIERHL